MPAKKYGRNRRPAARARTAARPAPAAGTGPAAAAQAGVAPAPAKPVPAKAPAKVPAIPPGTYPYIGGELKVIGILAAATLVALVVLAIVLR